MADTIRIQDYLGGYVQGVINQTTRGLRDLDEEELHCRPGENCNSIAFDAWHIARTADNLVHFAFEREKPVWLQQGLDEKWGLPKVDQGTGMAPEVAYALRFPEPSALIGYCNDVAAAIVLGVVLGVVSVGKHHADILLALELGDALSPELSVHCVCVFGIKDHAGTKHHARSKAVDGITSDPALDASGGMRTGRLDNYLIRGVFFQQFAEVSVHSNDTDDGRVSGLVRPEQPCVDDGHAVGHHSVARER